MFLPHRTKLFFDDNEAPRSVKRKIEQKNKWFFMQINYLCISYVLFVDIFTRSFDGFISMKFKIVVFLRTSPFINFGDFYQAPRLLHPSHLLFWPKFASLPVYFILPFYLKFKSMLFSRNSWIWIFVQLVLWMASVLLYELVSFACVCLNDIMFVCVIWQIFSNMIS